MLISDVENITGLSAKTIRYYEERGLIAVRRGENGYRYYADADVDILRTVRLMREVGIPIADIRLWRDGVVTLDELIRKRLRTIDDDSKRSVSCREMCRAILAGDAEVYHLTGGQAFVDAESFESADGEPLLLGIDIGTTSISAQVISAADGRCIQTVNIDHNAALRLENAPDACAADAKALTERALSLVKSLTGTYGGIAAIGVTGQMHGIVCTDARSEILSPLYTWQNGFGLRKGPSGITVCEEIERKSGVRIPTGYGIVTYYAMRELDLVPENTAKLCTVSDLLVSRLCGCEALSHPSNAAALGAFDLGRKDFDPEALESLHIPRSLLPAIANDYRTAGYFVRESVKIPVACAIGDNQSGVFGSLSDDGSVLINVGTSSQVSFVTEERTARAGEIRPYFDGKFLVSGAALCGGRAYSMLKDFIRSVLVSFGCEAGDRKIYEYLNSSARSAYGTGLVADTRFCGSRGDPCHRGSISNIGIDDFGAGDLAAAILAGIIEELYELYSDMRHGSDGREIVASGNAMRRNPVLRDMCARRFGSAARTPVHKEEAAYGAALYAGISAGLIDREKSRAMIKYNENEEKGR